MSVSYTLKTAVTALKRHKSRSLLTILGIVIGITAIIMVMALGKGAQDLILNQVQGMGAKTIVILPGRRPKGPADTLQSFSDSLRQRDIDALKNKANVPMISKVEPMVMGATSISYGSEVTRPTIFGISYMFVQIYDLEPEEGVFFTDDDIKGIAPVIVIGANVREELFGTGPAVGEKVKIKNKSFRVVGVLPKKGQSFINFDDAVLAPYTTAQNYIFGIKYFHRIIAEAQSEEAVKRTANDITLTLRELHNITDPDKDDFNVTSQADAMETVSQITNVLTLFLVSMAAISLIVGGVGIMNIMLVSVTERTREIGLRKALGATEKDIMVQFLMESVILTAAGGLIGIALGASFAYIVSLVLSKIAKLDWVFSFPLSAVMLGLGVSGFVGLVFGIYPARQASRKSPIEALRYE